MKKNYLIVCLEQAFIIIASALLFPVIAHSQDLTDAQRLDRCQNNKNRIVELESQLKVINADLAASMTKKEIEDARTQMVYVKKTYLSANPSKDELLEIYRVAAKYNFSFNKCTENCYTELEKIIAKKIDKANSLNRPELLAKKNEIDKQLASHRNNLVALRCDQPIVKKETDDFDYSKVSGTWQSDWGPVSLSVSKNSVSGSWKQSATETGQITGGSFDAKTKTLRFTYSQAWNKKTGKVALFFSETATGYNLGGSWSHDDNSGSGSWGMKRPK